MLVYQYLHSTKYDRYVILTAPITQKEYLSYKTSNFNPRVKYHLNLDERSKFVLNLATKDIPYNWIDNLSSILSDAIDILSEVYTQYDDEREFKQLLKTLLVNWSKSIPYGEVNHMMKTLSELYFKKKNWTSRTGSMNRIDAMGTEGNHLMTITTDNQKHYTVKQKDDNLLVVNSTDDLAEFEGTSLEQIQRACICNYICSNFQI